MKRKYTLILGDVIALTIITLIGFAAHKQATPSFAPRMLTTFIPALIAWFALAPFFGLFDAAITSNWKQLWRVIYVSVIGGAILAILRAAMLGGVALPLFAWIIGISTAVGMTLWRGLWIKLGKNS
jgi:hypothetical protein